MTAEKIILTAYVSYIIVMNIMSFINYKADKVKAKKNKWRIKESTLLGFGFFGGAIGAMTAMKRFRHKTKHWYFWVINLIGLIWQISLLIFLLFKS